MSPLPSLKNLAHLNSIWSVKIIFYQNCLNLKLHCWSWQKPTQNWFSSKPIFIPIVQQQVLDVYSMLTKFQVNLSVFESPNPCLKAVNSDLQFSRQIWWSLILFLLLSNLEVISVENTYKLLYPFSPLINTCNLMIFL